MKIMVGYTGGIKGSKALTIARDFAISQKATVYIVTSMEGGISEVASDIVKTQKGLDYAQSFMEDKNIKCKSIQSVQGLSPGEDIVRFAKEKRIDHIFLSIKKTSRVEKIILGSTARYVILKANCPVTTIK